MTETIVRKNPHLSIIQGKVKTTSRDVADFFEKRHDNVIQAINRLDCSEKFRLLNFQESSYTNEQGKEQPMFHMTRNGFVFLVMGFTGKNPAKFKEAYIEAFDQMESKLQEEQRVPSNLVYMADHLSKAFHELRSGDVHMTRNSDLRILVEAIDEHLTVVNRSVCELEQVATMFRKTIEAESGIKLL